MNDVDGTGSAARLDELRSLQERDAQAGSVLAMMLVVAASELITVAGALLEICDGNGMSVSERTRGRLDDSISRLTKMRGDLEGVAAMPRGETV